MWAYAGPTLSNSAEKTKGGSQAVKIGGKTRVGMTLSLGFLVGLGLVILPGLFATPTTNSTSTGTNVRTPTPTYTVGSSSSASQSNQTLTPTTGPLGNLVFTIALILFPAISISIFVRYWTLKSTKNKLESEDQKLR